MKSISVVMVSYHTGPILFDSIAAVLAQQSVIQMIVVDNGNPVSVVEDLQEQVGANEHFQLLTGHGNIGFSRACNLGVEKVTQNFLLLLNPDCIVTSEGLETFLDIAEASTGRWLLAPRLLNSDLSEQQGCRRELLTPWMAFVESTRLYRLFPRHPYFKRFNHNGKPLPAEVTEVPVTSGACMFLEPWLYRDLGGMDEGYFLHVEDIDFCLRFRKSGGEIFFCPQISFIHAAGSSETSRVFVEWHKSLGFKRYFRKHFTGMYPSGFIGLVNLLISVRFLLLAAKELLLHPVRLLTGHKKNIAG